MKFCENLQKLRKKKKISQEQLAELLGVTRQSVSKWESGASYPEMEKLTEMCKIFNCSLDTLINGDVDEQENKHRDNVVYQFIGIFDSAVKKTIAMLENMDPNQIVKFILSIILIAIIIALAKIPFLLIQDSINNILAPYGTGFSELLRSIWSFLISLAYGLFAIFAFFYIYKVKYLDRIEIDEVEGSETTKVKEEKVGLKQTKTSIKEKPLIYQQKTSFFDFLTKVIIVFIKVFVAIILTWVAFAFVTLIVLLVLAIIVACKGLFVIGPLLTLLSGIIFTGTIVTLLFDFLVNRKSKVTITVISFVASLVLGGIGVGLTFWFFADLNYINKAPEQYITQTDVVDIAMRDDLSLVHDFNVEYVVDDKMTDTVSLSLKYYYKNPAPKINILDEHDISYEVEEDQYQFYPVDFIEDIIADLKKKKFYLYDDLSMNKLIVKTSQDNITKIMTNTYHRNYASEDSDDIQQQRQLQEYLEMSQK